MSQNQIEGKLISTTAAAKQLGISAATLRNFVKNGRLIGFATTHGGRVNWITSSSLRKFIDSLES